ncbi:MAG TPA: carotenoid biosynthesis protein [Methylomirabilota bacterium]|jgi:putative membrane protein|nr:carotenoid biosynthesis protein [Methylomirabilota bacterium]
MSPETIPLPALLWNTVLLRPYVFVFLLAFIASAGRDLGGRRALGFFLWGWTVAFAAEYASTRVGIPFGLYHYTGVTAGRELYLSNVPFFDSISFVFLAYASLCLARHALGDRCWANLRRQVHSALASRRRRSARTATSLARRQPSTYTHVRLGRPTSLAPGLARNLPPHRAQINPLAGDRPTAGVVLVSGILMMLLDVVIDPLAVRGDRWFLGRIFYYPAGGAYFGVPLSNFAGWALVGWVTVGGYMWAMARVGGSTTRQWGSPRLGVALYYGVLLFNLALTLWIREWGLLAAGMLVHAGGFLLLYGFEATLPRRRLRSGPVADPRSG